MEQKVKDLIDKHLNDKDLSKEQIESGLDWSGANLEGFKLINLTFSTYKKPANFKNSNLNFANLNGSDFSYANFEYAQLQGASLQGKNTIFDGANLSNASLATADINGAKLKGTYLKSADLAQANLVGTDLSEAFLERAYLWKSNLKGANLFGANLENSKIEETDFHFANLFMCRFVGSNIEYAKHLDEDIHEIDGDKIDFVLNTILVDLKIEKEILIELKNDIKEKIIQIFQDEERYYKAFNVHRTLKNTFHQNGVYDWESDEHFRERKALQKDQFQKKKYGQWLYHWCFEKLCNYGEKPLRIIIWGILIILCFGFLYLFLGGPSGQNSNYIINSFYFSGVTFTTLGFGDLTPGTNNTIMKIIAVGEAIIGAAFIALFVAVLSRRIFR